MERLFWCRDAPHRNAPDRPLPPSTHLGDGGCPSQSDPVPGTNAPFLDDGDGVTLVPVDSHLPEVARASMRVVRTTADREGLAPRSTRRRPPRTHGQALVEFALVIPVMLLLVVGGLDAGRLFFTWIAVSDAAREGAAYAAGNAAGNPTDTSGISVRVNQEGNVQGQGGEGTTTITTTCTDRYGYALTCASAFGGNGTGNTVKVAVQRPFSFVTPVIGAILGNSVNLAGSATSAVYGYQPNGGDDTSDPCNVPTQADFTVTVSDLTVSVDAGASRPNSGRCAIASYDWDGTTAAIRSRPASASWTHGRMPAAPRTRSRWSSATRAAT